MVTSEKDREETRGEGRKIAGYLGLGANRGEGLHFGPTWANFSRLD